MRVWAQQTLGVLFTEVSENNYLIYLFCSPISLRLLLSALRPPPSDHVGRPLCPACEARVGPELGVLGAWAEEERACPGVCPCGPLTPEDPPAGSAARLRHAFHFLLGPLLASGGFHQMVRNRKQNDVLSPAAGDSGLGGEVTDSRLEREVTVGWEEMEEPAALA